MAKAKKFDSKKLAALFEEEGMPVTRVEVRKNDPTVTGKGVSKEVNKHAAQVVGKKPIKSNGPAASAKDEPRDVEPTPAEQKRLFRAAQQKALVRVLVLPPTAADLAMLKETTLDPGVKVMRYHGDAGWAVCLMWLEQKHDENTGPALHKIHALLQGDNSSLSYEKMRPDELRHFAEIQGGYPIGPGIEAFRKHADTYGATREVRTMLGMTGDAPPKMVTVQVRDDDGKLLGEKKVPKGSGASPHEPKPSADLDDLYKRTAQLLELKEEDLRQKYGHLGNGMQSMNLRNRLRGKGFNV